MESMIETLEEALVNGEEVFAYKRIAPAKDKKDPKVSANTFTAFESYIKKDTVADIGFLKSAVYVLFLATIRINYDNLDML